MGLEIGETSEESEDKEKEYLYCPYCEHHAESSDMLTPTFIAYLRRHLMREYVMPMVNKTLSNLADSFGGTNRGRSKGLISFEVKFEHNKPVLPPRPISGPEPPDMTIIELLCCGKKVKVLDGWYSLNLCPYCGVVVSIQ
jgi:DNA-directed RNA polymerase subunit RPC12/RpoP